MDGAFTPRIDVLIAQSLRLNAWHFDKLSAPYWRVYWNRTAGAVVNLNGQSTPVDSASLLVIPPETPFSTRLKRPVEHGYVHFTVAPMGRPEPAVWRLPISREWRRRASRIMDGFFPDAAHTLSLRLDALSLIHHALARVPEAWLKPVVLDRRVAAAIEQMERTLSITLPNDVLAGEAHMNTNAFIRLFSQQMGMGPQAYLTVKRIEKACALLHAPGAGIKEIAEATGFCDRYHFSRVFRKLRGVPPAEFRRRVCMQ